MIKKFEIQYMTSDGQYDTTNVYAFDAIDAKHAFVYGHPECEVKIVKQIS